MIKLVLGFPSQEDAFHLALLVLVAAVGVESRSLVSKLANPSHEFVSSNELRERSVVSFP